MPTLAITAAASAAAAYVTSKLWAPGTLGAAATFPVLIALLKEWLARPTYAVARAVPVRGVVRSAQTSSQPETPSQPPAPPEAAGGRVPQHGEVTGSSRPVPRRAWRTAVVTGVLGFIVAAVIVTVPEFVAGSSASGGGRQTTFFGGEKEPSESSTTTTTTSPDETETPPAGSTLTVPEVQTTTVPPAQTTTAPREDPTPLAPDGTQREPEGLPEAPAP